MKELSVRECLRAGWSGFKARPWLFIGSDLIILAASFIADLPRTLTQGSHTGVWAVGFIVFLISTGLSFLVSMGKTAFYLKAHDTSVAARLSDLWHPHPYWRYAGAFVLSAAVTILGLILFIVPGIILGIMFGFSLYSVIDKGLLPMEALRYSALITKGNRWKIFLLGLALLLLNIVGLCALIIGLLVTLPISTLAVVHAYRLLSEGKTAEPVLVTTP